MTYNELPGTLTLVNPELEHDPAGRKGDIGVVTYVDEPNNEVYIRFTDESEASYPSDALYILKDKVFTEQAASSSAIDLNGYKDLFKITMLQERDRPADIWQALEIARDNPAIRPGCLITVGECLDRRQTQTLGR